MYIASFLVMLLTVYLAIKMMKAYLRRMGAKWYHGWFMGPIAFMVFYLGVAIFEDLGGERWITRSIGLYVLWALVTAYREAKAATATAQTEPVK